MAKATSSTLLHMLNQLLNRTVVASPGKVVLVSLPRGSASCQGEEADGMGSQTSSAEWSYNYSSPRVG